MDLRCITGNQIYMSKEEILQRIKELETMQAKGNLDEQEENELDSLYLEL
jgi:hypothetical protein